MSEANNKKSLDQQAVHDYLQSLLLEVPDEISEQSEITSAPVPEQTKEKQIEAPGRQAKVAVQRAAVEPAPPKEPDSSPPVLGLDQLVAEVPDVLTETKTEVVTEAVTVIETEVQLEAQAPVLSDSAIPAWAESRFQCLLFKVSGLSLAVPLVKLNSVIPWNENITETPNQTDWYLGLVQHLQNQVKVIDTALLVMPENRRESLENDTSDRLSHILLVDDYQWGLACSSIGDVIWLTQEEVKWRKNKTSRAWLAGTSLEHLCAIMDTEVFAQMLTETT